MIDQVLAALQGDRPAGLYKVSPPIDPVELAQHCQQLGFQLFVVDGTTISSKASFLAAIAQAMQFPDYFGNNWDAFEDCITDLDWLSATQYVILYTEPEHFAQAQPADWKLLLTILHATVEDWKQSDSAMYVFFQSTSPTLDGLE